MSRKNITYLLGAGASRRSLPLLSEFILSQPELQERASFSMDFFLTALKQVSVFHEDRRFESLVSELVETTQEVFNGLMSGKHSTIDTWAKKSLIQGDQGMMQKIKAVTNLYLSSLEYLNGNDPRYETFFSNILSEGSSTLPENLKILSWNYDRQVQSAILRVLNNKGLYRYNDRTFRDYNIQNYIHRDNHLKINGELSCYSNEIEHFQSQRYLESSQNLSQVIRALLTEQLKVCNGFRSDDIQYAWNEERIVQYFNNSKEFFECNMLVVIGYSFPDSNRKIDVKILERMKGTLSKLVIQDVNAEVVLDKVKDVMEGAGITYREGFVRLINNCDNFYIPNDLLY